MSTERRSASFLVVHLLALACLLAGCADADSPGGPYVWIDAPIDGLRVPSNQPVQIEGHVTYSEGVARVEIWVDGELHLIEENPPAEGNLARFEQSWMPPGPGDHTVQVVAIGADGSGSEPDSVRVYVGEALAEATPPPTATPVETGIPPTATPTSPPPTAVPTAPPPTPVPTIPPSPTPVPTVPPPPTATPTSPPPPTAVPTPTPGDTTAPPAPVLLKPLDGSTIDPYATIMLRWSPVSDPSGISEYRVRVERHSGDANWEELEDSPWHGLTAPEFELEIESGWTYRWRVRAVDGAGNPGPFSGWFEFTVSLT